MAEKLLPKDISEFLKVGDIEELEFVCLNQMERIEFCKRGVGYEHFNSLLFWRR